MPEVSKGRPRPYLYLLAVASPILTTLITLPILTRSLDARSVGVATLVLMLAQLISILVVLGMPGPLTRAYFAEDELDVRAICHRMSLVLSWAALLSSLAHMSWMVSLGTYSWMVAGTSFGLSWAAFTMRQVISRALGRSLLFTGQTILAASVPQFSSVIAILFQPAMFFYFIGLHIGVAVASGLNLLTSRSRRALNWSLMRATIRTGLPTLPHGLSLFLFAAAIRFDASVVAGLEAAAQLQVAALLGQGPLTVIGALNNSWNVGLYQRKERDWGLFLRLSIGPLFAVCFSLMAVVAGIGPFLVGVLAGPLPGHAEILLAAVITSVSAVPLCIYLANMHVLVGLGRTTGLALATPVSLLVGLSFGHLLGSWLGLWGFAVTTPIAYVALAILTTTMRKKSMDFSLISRRWRVAVPLALLGLAAVTLSHGMVGLITAIGGALVLPFAYRRFERNLAK